ncbi:citrate/2-methylcitrate synthase [Prescottella defluvii]|nr:citrate/2-methylcitrate synthase [Prescottella defluvii]
MSGLEGVVAFTTDIAEPDKDGGALRYRGVDIEDLVGRRVTFGNVWALLVDGKFGAGLPRPSRSRSPSTPVTCASTCRPASRCSRRSGATSRCSTSTTRRPARTWPARR